MPKPVLRAVLARMQFTRHAARRTPDGASRLVQSMSAWLVKTRRAPSRHSRDERVYGHTTTAMHKLVTPPPAPSVIGRDLVQLATNCLGIIFTATTLTETNVSVTCHITTHSINDDSLADLNDPLRPHLPETNFSTHILLRSSTSALETSLFSPSSLSSCTFKSPTIARKRQNHPSVHRPRPRGSEGVRLENEGTAVLVSTKTKQPPWL